MAEVRSIGKPRSPIKNCEPYFLDQQLPRPPPALRYDKYIYGGRLYAILTAECIQSPSDSITMSYVAKGDKEYDATGAPLPPAKIHKIRITLTSGNVKNLEKCLCLTVYSFLETFCAHTVCSLDRPHQQGQGQEPPCQGTRQAPHEGPEDYNPQIRACSIALKRY